MFCILLILSPNVRAAEDVPVPPKGDFSELKRTGTARVDQVIDGLTILLKDKRVIRLSALDIPGYADAEPGTYATQSTDLLRQTLPEGAEIILYQTVMAKKGRANRMGQELAQIEAVKDGVWIQGLLLSRGLARVLTLENTPEMARQMYAAEKAAREAKRMLWADPAWLLLTPETSEGGIGKIMVVEGTVQKVATVSNNVYLNFGNDWKTDFTVLVSPLARKSLAKLSIDPLQLEGKTVRVRGFIRSYNGPFMELDHPARLELSDAPAPAKVRANP